MTRTRIHMKQKFIREISDFLSCFGCYCSDWPKDISYTETQRLSSLSLTFLLRKILLSLPSLQPSSRYYYHLKRNGSKLTHCTEKSSQREFRIWKWKKKLHCNTSLWLYPNNSRITCCNVMTSYPTRCLKMSCCIRMYFCSECFILTSRTGSKKAFNYEKTKQRITWLSIQ